MANFSTNQKYLDLTGLQSFWTKIKNYILTHETKVEAQHAASDKVWVNVIAGEAGANGITYTIDDTAVNTKFVGIDNKLTELVTADTQEAGSRKLDVQLLAGDKYTAGTGGNVGSWAAEGSPKYKSITTLSNRLAAIDANLVTDIKEGNSKETYVTLSVTPSTAVAGDHSITITIDDTALSQKVNSLETADTTETTARKATDALLAGNGWNKDTGVWTTIPAYATIAQLSQQMKAAEASINALSNAVQFLGVSSSTITNNGTQKPTIDGSVVSILDAGDVVFYETKEFIWDGAKWIELGDTTVENQRLAYLEGWITNNAITEAEITALFA